MTINETSIEDAFLRESASRKLLARVSSPCAILVLTALGADAMNYRSLRHKLDRISPKVLTHTLSRLERDGLVLRQSPQATAHYDTSVYTLINSARSLSNIFGELKTWSDTYCVERRDRRRPPTV